MRILWVKTGPLLPLDTGGKRRTHAMLTEISKDHEVTYLSLLPEGSVLDPREEADPYASQKIWVKVSIPAKRSPLFWVDLAWNSLISSQPYALHKYDAAPLRKKLHEFSGRNDFDLVICDFLAPALNFLGLVFKCPTVLFQHNIEAQIWQRLAASQSSALKRWYLSLQHRRMHYWEARLSAVFDGVITVSPEDTELARSHYNLPNVLGHVPTGVDVEEFSPAPPANSKRSFTIGFLGSMDWMPNIDAVLYFDEEILPSVRAKWPESRFKVIGRSPSSKIKELAIKDPLLEVTGTVDSIQPHVHDCDVIVVPLKAGGGTRIKIYEAMAMGVPVVSTSIGAEGLAVQPGEDIVIADTSADFANAIVSLAEDPVKRKTIAENARHKVKTQHSWAAATRRFMELCLQCVTKK